VSIDDDYITFNKCLGSWAYEPDELRGEGGCTPSPQKWAVRGFWAMTNEGFLVLVT